MRLKKKDIGPILLVLWILGGSTFGWISLLDNFTTKLRLKWLEESAHIHDETTLTPDDAVNRIKKAELMSRANWDDIRKHERWMNAREMVPAPGQLPGISVDWEKVMRSQGVK